jgi:hypothetical protein
VAPGVVGVGPPLANGPVAGQYLRREIGDLEKGEEMLSKEKADRLGAPRRRRTAGPTTRSSRRWPSSKSRSASATGRKTTIRNSGMHWRTCKVQVRIECRFGTTDPFCLFHLAR